MNFQFTKIVLLIARQISKLVIGLIDLLAAGTDTSKEQSDTQEGDLIGVYNFRTQKYDNGTDPYGWYEEDL